jgi:23S rRNA pseudouridine955/2504/2580 synthase
LGETENWKIIMSRRVKRPLAKRTTGDRPKGARPYRGSQAERPAPHRPGGKPPRFAAPRREPPAPFVAEPAKVVPEPPPLPTKVQTVVVTADENNMRVDRFLEARFPGLSFSHIQRIVRKGELRVNGKRADSKDRLEEGQNVRIPPLKLDTPKVAGELSDAGAKTLQTLKEMILYEDPTSWC